jgi:mannose-6-phosphate isomerase-like protein (cupin superfamily)
MQELRCRIARRRRRILCVQPAIGAVTMRAEHMMKTSYASILLVAAVCAWPVANASAQAVAGADRARPVAGDPGLSTMVVIDRPEFRVLRDYAEPGATRRMHSHDDATYHVFVLVTGQLLLTIEGDAPVEVTPGQALYLKGGAKHTFRNTGTVAATIVEVFGKGAAAPPADEAAALARAVAR